MQVFEPRDWVEAQMQDQAVSYSESLARAILAAGRRPPPWLFPTLDAVPARGTEHQIFCFDIAMEINSDSCEIVSDKQTQAARPCAQHLLHSSRCGEITLMKSDVQSTDSHQGRSVADVIQVQGNSSCEMIEMNCQSDHALYSSSSTMSTSSMDCQHEILDKMENRADISGKPQHSVFHLDSSGSRECISLDLE